MIKKGKWYRSQRAGGCNCSCDLGFMYASGRSAQDCKEAVKWYRKSAEQGDAIAQYNLVLSTMLEKESPKILSCCEVMKVSREAAIAQCNLGLMYEKGGSPQDHIHAVGIESQPSRGICKGSVQPGFMYDKGKGVPQIISMR